MIISIPFSSRRIAFNRLLFKLGLFFRVLCTLTKINQPLSVFKSYWTQTPIQQINYRGKTIWLSHCGHDSSTFMTVFAHRYYGRIPKSAVVIDVGANIGLFSLDAVWSGAAKVYAYEPNAQSFEVLNQNLREHNITNVVATQCAVSGNNQSSTMFIGSQSTPFNKLLSQSEVGNHDQTSSDRFSEVKVESIDTVLKTVCEPIIDLLKIDCEGAEYGIFQGLTKEHSLRIRMICVEYEVSDSEKPEHLIQLAENCGFIVKEFNRSHKRLRFASTQTA